MGAAFGTVVIVGVSTRALAESAARAGYRCVTVDAFGDLDQRVRVHNVSLLRDLNRPYAAASAVALARRCTAEAAAYTANLENHPAAVRRLARERLLLGNGPEALRGVRDPWRVAEVVRATGGRFPLTLPPDQVEAADPASDWLRKPRAGGGGGGVAVWRAGETLRPQEVLQRRVRGLPASALFVADGRQALLLGLTRQLVGEPTFHARGFRYCGNLFPLPAEPERLRRLEDQMQALACQLAGRFGLRGLGGIDFVLDDRGAWVVEVNPRPTAAMELLERSLGCSVFDLHVRGCLGELPRRSQRPCPSGTHGKAILFARQATVLPDTRPWLERDHVRDIPFPGDRIRVGRPICTVFAQGPDASLCRVALDRAAAAIERELFAGAGADD